VCRAVSIGVIVYSRDNGIFTPETVLRLAENCPNLIGLKDGTGDFEAMGALKRDAGDRLIIINGVPTAEILARQFFSIGVRAYSSAVFSFLPPLAMAFFRAVSSGDVAKAEQITNEFYLPITKLRSRKRGYAVSIIKAGLRAIGKPAGPVRPPLLDLDAGEQDELAKLIATGRKFI
jgi:5-dehydro-4-deoxyglucarate dehydratase